MLLIGWVFPAEWLTLGLLKFLQGIRLERLSLELIISDFKLFLVLGWILLNVTICRPPAREVTSVEFEC